MIDVMEAEEAWCPPTFTPDGVSRTLLAWLTSEVANQSTRLCTASSVSTSCATATELSATR